MRLRDTIGGHHLKLTGHSDLIPKEEPADRFLMCPKFRSSLRPAAFITKYLNHKVSNTV